MLVLAAGSKAEISNLGITSEIDEDVVWLEIAVDYAVPVDMDQALDRLSEKSPYIFVVHLFPYEISQGLPLTVFHLYVLIFCQQLYQ